MPLREGAAASMIEPDISQHYSTMRQPDVAHILPMTHISAMGWGPVETDHAPLVYQLRSSSRPWIFRLNLRFVLQKRGKGEELIEVFVDVLGDHYHSVDEHWFTDVEMDITTCPLDQTDGNSRRLQQPWQP